MPRIRRKATPEAKVLSAPSTMPAPVKGNDMDFLRTTDVFQDLDESIMSRLMEEMPSKVVPKGTVLCGSNGQSEALYILREGNVELFHATPDGRRLTVASIGPGTFFGEMGLIGQSLKGTCAIMVEDSLLCVLKRQDLETLIQDHPAVAIRLVQVLAKRLEESRDLLYSFVFGDVPSRVAKLLLKLAEGKSLIIEGHSHQELAAMAGCQRETFTQTLDGFKGTGAVQVGRKWIQITDRSQLDWLAQRV
jgi:CRP-like cAMP-binding protein